MTKEPDQDKIDQYIEDDDVHGLSRYLENYPIKFLKQALHKIAEIKVKNLWGDDDD